jgi:hypothetical protein
MTQQFWPTILLFIFETRVVLIEHIPLLWILYPPRHRFLERWRLLGLRWFMIILSMSHIFELILSILICVIMMTMLCWGAFAFHWLFELVAAHTDLAVLTLSQRLGISTLE